MPLASRKLHNVVLQTTVLAPLSLFTTSTSGSGIGEIVNHFSLDLQLIDMELPLALFNTTIELLFCIAQLLLISTSTGYIAAVLPFVLVVFYIIQKFYLRTARQLRLLNIEATAPLISNFLSTLSGLVTIRAFGWQSEYEERCRNDLEASQRPSYLLYSVQRWLNLVLDLVVAAVAVVLVSIGVKTKGDISPGLIGVAFVNIVGFSVSIKALLENWTVLETSIGAVSRIREFERNTPRECAYDDYDEEDSDGATCLALERGSIEFQNVTAKWDGKTKPTIKDATFTIEPGKKVAIVGKSGR